MNKQGKEDEFIRQFIGELGTENPSIGFHKSIVAKLNHVPFASVYKPVISALAWKIIGCAIASIVISVLLFLPGGQNSISLVDQVSKIPFPQVTISLPKVSLPVLELSSLVIQSLVVFIVLGIITVITTLTKWKIS
ncbi:hypothetical protein [Algoriphagus resistens]|uniref:hypothetical protein n=1 Tax=Algoriphagus resistens TaxID=1750590 RepID=UPI00071691B1|nr:hypothetical protein [Algoriphagus resistens]